MLTKQQLLRHVTPDETASEFFSRQVSEAVATGVFCIDQHVKLRPGQVLEMVGPTGTGKSELLAQVRMLLLWAVMEAERLLRPSHRLSCTAAV